MKPSICASGRAARTRATQRRRLGTHAGAVRDTERDAADIALVGDVGRADFQGDRKSDRGGRGDRLVGIGRILGARLRNAVSGEHGSNFLRIEPGPPRAKHMGDDRSNRRLVGLERIGTRRRRFQQQRLVVLVADAVQKAGHRRLGSIVGRDARRVEAAACVPRPIGRRAKR